MFQMDFGQSEKEPTAGAPEQSLASRVALEDVSYVRFLRWEEHCLECAAPSCFKTCDLFVPRADRMCARFYWGIRKKPRFKGLFEFGAELKFRRWAHLKATFTPHMVSPRFVRHLSTRDLSILRVINPIASIYNPLMPVRKTNLNIMYNRLRAAWLDQKVARKAVSSVEPDDFVVEVFNPTDRDVRFVLELADSSRAYTRHAVLLQPGHNLQTFPWSSFWVPEKADGELRFKFYPENDQEVPIIVTWLYPVKWAEGRGLSGHRRPAAKVKCVVWDLDNTVWNGTLVEDNPERLTLRENVLSTIEALDRRGVLQSIASKNDHDAAWRVLERLSISRFFIAPEIHWNRKSESLKNIAHNLNIGIDTFAFLDDSDFEREEVSTRLPEVRVFGLDAIPHLLDRPEFQMPETIESARRRGDVPTGFRQKGKPPILGRRLRWFSGQL